MAAEIKPRAEVDNRTKLEKVLPLNTPFTIFIDPSDGCNFQCTFCPTGERSLIRKIGRKPIKMNFDLFKKIIDDLDEFKEPIKLLRLHKDGEPLLNKDFPKMVAYAKQSPNILKVDTTTNASLLNPNLNLEIIEAGLDRINISIEGMTEEHYKNIAKFNIDFEKLVYNIEHFYKNKKQCEVSIKVPGDWLSNEEKELFFKIFSPIADRIFIENISNCWPNYDMQDMKFNSEHGVYGDKKMNLDVCPYIFYSMVINSNGTVSACCVDWERKLLIGDSSKEKIHKIWKGEKLKKLQILHLKKERGKHSVCGKCSLAESCSADNIDNYASEILTKVLK